MGDKLISLGRGNRVDFMGGLWVGLGRNERIAWRGEGEIGLRRELEGGTAKTEGHSRDDMET